LIRQETVRPGTRPGVGATDALQAESLKSGGIGHYRCRRARSPAPLCNFWFE
jgi:hypothetical protein